MPLKRLTSLFPVLSSAEVRAHLRQVDAEESALIEAYILASQNDIEIQCERAICTAKYRLVLPTFPCGSLDTAWALPFASDDDAHSTSGSAIELQMCPARRVDSIGYFDGDNDAQTYDSSILDTDSEPALLRQSLADLWPETYSRPDAVTVTFWAGEVAPLSVDLESGSFTSLSGFPFSDDDEVVISKSGNTNAALGDVAALPAGLSERTTYFVVSSTGTTFQIAATVGGEAISLDVPAIDGQSIDLLFAGELQPFHRLALLQMTAKAFGERCPAGGCVCTDDDFRTNPMLRRLKWRSPVEFY